VSLPLRLLRPLVRMILRLLYRVEVQGSVPAMPERAIIIANHQSFLDAFLIGCFVDVDATWVVHRWAWDNRFFRLFLRHAPIVVIDSASPMSMKTLVEAIESGKRVAVFPEGRITVTGSLMKVYEGAAFLAARAGAAILPVVIEGATNSWFSRMQAPWPSRMFPKMRLTILPLARIEMPAAPRARDRRRLAAEELRRVMQDAQVAARPRTTLYEEFLNAVDLHGRGRPVMSGMDYAEQTYGNVIKASMALGRLVGKLTAEGEYVGVLMPNVPATSSLVLGMLATRRVPAMLNYTSGSAGLQAACELARVKTVITSRAFIEKAKLGDVVARISGPKLIYLEDLRPMFGLADKLWLILRAMPFPRSVMVASKPDDPAVVLFTSGSEGKPKGVVLSHANLLANYHQGRAIIEFSVRDKFFCALPLFHSFGLMGGIFLPLLSGAKVILYPSPLHYRVIPEMVYDRDCTILFGTPTFLANYAKAAHAYDFYSLRVVVSGAEKLNDETRRLWTDKFGIRIMEGYGATECAPIISLNTPLAWRAGTVGEIAPGLEWRLLPVAGIEGGGELHVKGPNVMLGYLLHDQPGVIRPPESQFGAGWYATGDVVEIDRRFIAIKGRIKRFAKVAGEMVSLEVVEKVAQLASPGRAHAATAVPDGRRGEAIILFTEDRLLSRELLAAAARDEGLPDFAVARRVQTIEKIPLLGNGKCDYVRLREMGLEFASHA